MMTQEQTPPSLDQHAIELQLVLLKSEVETLKANLIRQEVYFKEELRQKEETFTYKIQEQKEKIDSLNSGIARALWILGGGFIAAIVSYIVGGGFKLP